MTTGNEQLHVRPVAERALNASWVANGIAGVALIGAIISAFVSCQQLRETQRVNDVLLATKASNVFFDSTRSGDGTLMYFIENRNKEPVLDVYYNYRIRNIRSVKYVFLGVVAACSSVQLVPPDGEQRVGFTPVDLFLKDNDGNSWHREESGRIQRVDKNPISQAGRDFAPYSAPIEGGC
jgi:hypothetical protein